jgi:DNA-binding NtrC family response regulator
MHTVAPGPPRRDFDVLIADDDPGVREVLAEFLAGRGLAVATTPDGRAAVTALERAGAGCRLVFADIAMPGADGFAVLSAARQANPSSYVVMITGYGSLETAISAVRLGAQDYLTKPFSLGQVDVILRKANTRHAEESGRAGLPANAVVAALAAIDARLLSMETQLRELAHRGLR